ncbi:L,D-transpeptidase family protein [Candidatus Pelagibacter sp.]|jgi:L,D-peptidoglycan transpeptidase YkuD (ErfK/YbiS/YcfS/YnhG family)|nr:L,D-transpeptidase family protein [Candidatus Pelagibacter sp.]|tara:strand:+ start:78 stop:566 length:489 start_codon:yes stop_codon:yes gene_type:complete
MIIHVKDKNTLIIDDFKLKCCIGKNGLNSNKREGDYSTPKGVFNLKKLYFRKERLGTPKCKIAKKIIKKNMAWCDDPNHKKYNEEIKTYNKKLKESLYRRDHKYDYVITISHNEQKVPNKGSAVFIHLTDDYEPTAGCIALQRKDFEILIKLIDKKTKIKIG